MSRNPCDSKKINSLSIVLPVYNEERIINKNILFLNNTLKTICKDYEIIVVDDCSIDRSPEILITMSSQIEKLKVTRNVSNQGLGDTLRKGFSMVTKELVFYTDMDLPFDCSQIYRAVEILETTKADMVAGVRRNRIKEESVVRILCSFLYNWLIKNMFHIKIRDVNFAFKLIKKYVLDELNLKSASSFIDAEIVVKVNYLGYQIRQTDIDYIGRKDSGSRLFKPRIILFTLLEMLRYYREIKKLRKINEKVLDS